MDLSDIPFTDIREHSPEWHEARARHLTGTDASAILGAAKWKTPLDIWNRLVLDAPQPKKETAFMRWGTMAEPWIARLFQEETGFELTPNDRLVRSPRIPFVGTPDAFIVDPLNPGQGVGILEMKAPSIHSAHDWDEGRAPDYYVVQAKAYMIACGLRWGALAALVPPSRHDDALLRTTAISVTDAEAKDMEQRMQAWWDRHVRDEEQPEAIEHDRELVRSLAPDERLHTLLLDDDTAALAFARADAKDREKEAVRAYDAATNELMRRMGASVYAQSPEGDVTLSLRAGKNGKRTLRTIKALPKGAPFPSGPSDE